MANLSPGGQLGGRGVVPTGLLQAWPRGQCGSLAPWCGQTAGNLADPDVPEAGPHPCPKPLQGQNSHGRSHGQPSPAVLKLMSTTWTLPWRRSHATEGQLPCLFCDRHVAPLCGWPQKDDRPACSVMDTWPLWGWPRKDDCPACSVMDTRPLSGDGLPAAVFPKTVGLHTAKDVSHWGWPAPGTHGEGLGPGGIIAGGTQAVEGQKQYPESQGGA